MIEQAIRALQQRGHTVEPADIPGLWWVSGYPELTTAQLVNVADIRPAFVLASYLPEMPRNTVNESGKH